MANLVDEARNGSVEGVRRELDAGANPDQKNAQGDTALLWAASLGKVEIARLLIDHGADVRLANSGITPLALARTQHHAEVAALLEAAEARPRGANESWKKMGVSTVAHVGVYPAIDEKLTSVFNFASRERYIISEGILSGRKAVGPSTGFDALPHAVIEEALAEFAKLGGVADKERVLSALDKPKIKLAVG